MFNNRTTLGKYAVSILDVDNMPIYPVDGGYYPLRHNTRFKIRMESRNHLRSNAIVTIDGEKVGTWRIESLAIVERPQHQEKCFTFYREDTAESRQGGITSGAQENGLVSVEFIPEKCRGGMETQTPIERSAPGTRSYSSGGTALSGKSSQQFTTATSIPLDHDNSVTITVRLVVDERETEPDIVPLGRLATAVPPRI